MSWSTIIRQGARRAWLVFALVFAWKVALLVFSAQPIPANDSFFYDGAVVHFLDQGGYFNPAVALARPISGTEVFSAYPPFYQAVLLAWMSVFGASALSAMWMHLVLFGLYLLAVLAIFRRLAAPGWCVNLAGLFLLSLTFHDRPDSLAHVLGMLGIYAWVRARSSSTPPAGNSGANLWLWLATAFGVLTLCTSLQIGGVYFGWLWLATLMDCLVSRRRFPLLPMTALVLVPAALVALVRFGYPQLWRGFMENVKDNPSLTGWHVPVFVELLKIGRNVPGILAVAVVVLALAARKRWWTAPETWDKGKVIFVSGMVAALLVVGGSLSCVTPNWIIMASYLQPLLAGLFFVVVGAFFTERARVLAILFLAVLPACLGSIRAVGMSTWGLACAADVSYPAALERVRAELQAVSANGKVLVSSAYLYEAGRWTNGVWIHSDYPTAPGSGQKFAEALQRLKVRKLVLTQFDYYRRYKMVLADLQASRVPVEITVENTARVRAPDSYERFQQVVQHISWAPVIVTLTWK